MHVPGECQMSCSLLIPGDSGVNQKMSPETESKTPKEQIQQQRQQQLLQQQHQVEKPLQGLDLILDTQQGNSSNNNKPLLKSGGGGGGGRYQSGDSLYESGNNDTLNGAPVTLNGQKDSKREEEKMSNSSIARDGTEGKKKETQGKNGDEEEDVVGT